MIYFSYPVVAHALAPETSMVFGRNVNLRQKTLETAQDHTRKDGVSSSLYFGISVVPRGRVCCRMLSAGTHTPLIAFQPSG